MVNNLLETTPPGAPVKAYPLKLLWGDRRIGAALVVVIAGLSGLLITLTMPRGPITTAMVLLVMLNGLVVGMIGGFILRSRWAMLLVLFVNVLVVEIARPQLAGPSVGSIRFDDLWLMAFVVYRGIYALVGLLPMVFGASLGVALARRIRSEQAYRSKWLRYAMRGFTGLVAVLLVGLAVLFLIPASTPPILGADGKTLPGSIAELTTVRLGGYDQSVLIRGYSADKPIILYISGGPGQSDLPFQRVIFGELAQDFIVVGFDQRGTGKSYSNLDPTTTLTIEQNISDTVELTNYLRQRFHQEKVYLMGESWGTLLGVLAVQRRPELYYAFIGSGQMVSLRETDRRLYYDVLDYAARTGDNELAGKMKAFGEPPYKDPLAGGFVSSYYDKIAGKYSVPKPINDRLVASGVGPLYGVFGSEFSMVEKVNALRGLMDVYSIMYPQAQGVDFRRDVTQLQVPVYLMEGQYELKARSDLALEWFNQLQAPVKRLYSLDNAGHDTVFEGFHQFQKILKENILPETYPGR